ncbi:MAG: hypothetical protein JO306_14475 [Gemmatimonadetes bacterium]|nr:hypothetical protein [Gemmatimonadota bacterium]
MASVAAPNGNRGILRQLHLVRTIRIDPPVAAPAASVAAAVAEELRGAGYDLVRERGGAVEFYDDDPPAFLFEMHGPRLPINGGVVMPDPAAPGARMTLELWLSPCVYVEPIALTALILIAPMLPTTKATLLVILLGLAAMHFVGAREALERRLAAAARAASADRGTGGR